jgi:hypothetical protein
MANQLQFDGFPEEPQNGYSATPKGLVRFLEGRRDWTPGKTVALALGVDERTVRSIREQCAGAVLGNTQHGYKATSEATSHEIKESVWQLKAHAKREADAARDILKFCQKHGISVEGQN